MPVEVIALGAFAIVFALGTFRSVNMGVLALVAAFLVGTLVYGATTEDVIAGFPGEMFIILVGVTYLFSIASHNGTIDWLVRASVRMVGGRLVFVPWAMFLIPALLTAVGAAAPAACAIIIPIGLKFAARHKINPVLMSMMVIQGTTAGGFSPIGIYGLIVNGIGDSAGLPTNPVLLFVGTFMTTLAVAAIAFVAMGGLKLRGQRAGATPAAELVSATVGGGAREDVSAATSGVPGRAAGAPSSAAGGDGGVDGDEPGLMSQARGVASGESGSADQRSLTPEQLLNLLGVGVLVGVTLVFGLNVGFVALCVAAVLALIFTESAVAAVQGVAWSTVLLIGGIMTYVSLLKNQGTIDWLGSGIADIGTPLIASFVILLIGAVVSAFASTTALLGVVIPLATPFLLTGQIGVIPLIIALAVSSSVVDCSPLSTMGALAVANAEESDRGKVFSGLMRWGMGLIVAAPVLTFCVLVLPSSF